MSDEAKQKPKGYLKNSLKMYRDEKNKSYKMLIKSKFKLTKMQS